MRISLFIIILMTNHFVHAQETNMLFDNDWKFFRGASQGAERAAFDDSKWRSVDLPHDWSIEDMPGTNSPFNKNAVSQVSGGFTTGGTGLYRKNFTVPASQKNKQTIIQFDGVYMNADVYLNGELLGNHPYGYTSFYYDITGKLKYNDRNTLAVKVKNEGENSRWYSGSGIYRHVWLKTFEPIHIANWGTFVRHSNVNKTSATTFVTTRVANETKDAANIRITNYLLDASGKEISRKEITQQVAAKSAADITNEISVLSPELWNIESPYLYTLVTELRNGDLVIGRNETKTGIRSIGFDAVHGFMLNGEPLKLKGGCIHHDNGPLGAAAFDRAEERRIELLKQSGYNTVRCAHNPPSPALLDACDRLGMMVIDETFDMWREGKNPYDYHLWFNEWWQRDVESMVLRDRNHPSIILWSIGNEIPERGTEGGVKTAGMLADFIRQLDATRSVMSAVNGLGPDKDPYFAKLDVAGYNYAVGGDYGNASLHETDHKRVPNRVIIGTESYPLDAFGAWMEVVDHPYVAGDFVWTAFDYIGEASIGWRGYWQYQDFFPWNLAYCGDLDICGHKRPQSFYRDALWKKDQLSVFVKPPQPSFPENKERQSWSRWHWDDVIADWNWNGNEGKKLQVNVYSSCDEVELFLNSKSLGKKTTNRATKFIALFDVPYAAGVLKAVGYTNGVQVNSSHLITADKPAKIGLRTDRQTIQANSQEICYIDVDITDMKGNHHPKAVNDLQFSISGPAEIIAVANANPLSLESYKQPKRKSWQGRAMVIIKSAGTPGKIQLHTTSAGLISNTITIEAK